MIDVLGQICRELHKCRYAPSSGKPWVWNTETTALCAAYAAGLATGFWSSEEVLRKNWAVDKQWKPVMAEADREKLYSGWLKAIERTFNWVE